MDRTRRNGRPQHAAAVAGVHRPAPCPVLVRLPDARAERRRRVAAAPCSTAEQLAERWSIPVSQAYRLARDGRIKCLRLGRYVRFALAEVEAFERGGNGSAS